MIDRQPLVSVIMGAYNEERFIHQAVASILNQTFRDLELIIIDDGSTDQTAKILSAIEDPRVKVISSRERKGLTASLNMAISLTGGRYIARMDADDLSEPTRLEEQIDYMERFPELGLIGSWYLIIDENDRPLWERPLPTSQQLKETILEWNPFCHGSVLFRKEVVNRVGFYRTEFKYSQDYDLWLRIKEHYDIDNIPKYLYKWRISMKNIGISNRWLQKRYSVLAREFAVCRRNLIPEPLWETTFLNNTSMSTKEYLLERLKGIIWPILMKFRIDPERFENFKWPKKCS